MMNKAAGKNPSHLSNSGGAGEYLSDEKENYSEESNSMHETEMKRRLFENLKRAGVLDGMKSTLRGRLYEQLRLKQDRPQQKDKANQLSFKIAASLVADLMQKCEMPYALSVFLPESGLNQELFSKAELIEVLGLVKDENYAAALKHEMTPVLLDLVEIIKSAGSVRPNRVAAACQTDDAADVTLEQKLKRIDSSLHDQADRLVPFKILEERQLKYKRELEDKYAADLESAVRRLKDFELSKIRIEEAQKYRQKIQEYRDELEQLQQDKLRELKVRESEAWERIKNRERDLDKQAFE